MSDLGRVLVTGGSGFLGHEITRQLLPTVDALCIYSRGEWRQAQMAEEFGSDKLRFFIGDVRDRERLQRAMHGVDTVIHAAALKRIEVGNYNPTEMAATNVGGTINALLAAEAEKVLRFVLVSSDKAFAPVNAYGATKLLAERIVLGDVAMRGDRLPAVRVCRYGNVAGSTGSVIPVWRSARERGVRPRITDLRATRFWMTRQEAAELVIGAAAARDGPSVIIPDLPAFQLWDLATAMGFGTGGMDVIGLQPGEKMDESMDEGKCSKDARRMTVPELAEALKDV